MGWAETISKLLSADFAKVDKTFEECRAQIDAVLSAAETLLKATDPAQLADASHAVSRLISDFAWPMLIQIQVEVPFWRRTAIKQLRTTLSGRLQTLLQLATVASTAPERLPQVSQALASLRASRTELDYLHSQSLLSVRTSRRWTFGVLSVAGLGMVLAFLGRFYIGLQTGIEPLSREIVFPPGPHEAIGKSQGIQLISAPRDLDPFLDDFSHFYFGKASRPVELVRKYEHDKNHDKGEYEIGQRWKFILRNKSRYLSEFVSSMEMRVTLEKPEQFPWRQMPVTPSIKARSQGHARVLLYNDGPGPGLDIEWTTESGTGLKIGEGKQWLLHDECELDVLQKANIAGSFWFSTRDIPTPIDTGSSVEDTDESHADPEFPVFYLMLDSPPNEELIPKNVFEHEGTWYEAVSTFQRFKQVTPTATNEKFVLNLKYSSIDGQQKTLHLSDQLPEGCVFYEKESSLLDYDPRETRTTSYKVVRSVQETVTKVENVLLAFSNPPLQPRGVDLLVEYFFVDTNNVETGRSRAQSFPVDRYLNPRGHICLYLDLANPRSGTYIVEVIVNGESIDQCRVRCIYPERLSFPSQLAERWKDIVRLRTVFETAPKDKEMPDDVHLPLTTDFEPFPVDSYPPAPAPAPAPAAPDPEDVPPPVSDDV